MKIARQYRTYLQESILKKCFGEEIKNRVWILNVTIIHPPCLEAVELIQLKTLLMHFQWQTDILLQILRVIMIQTILMQEEILVLTYTFYVTEVKQVLKVLL